MPRWAAKVDGNQREIVRALRGVGASVALTHRIGGGYPDLTVGFRGRNYLMEVKTQDGSLNDLEQDFFRCWRGHAMVVRSVDEALRVIGALDDQEYHGEGVA